MWKSRPLARSLPHDRARSSLYSKLVTDISKGTSSVTNAQEHAAATVEDLRVFAGGAPVRVPELEACASLGHHGKYRGNVNRDWRRLEHAMRAEAGLCVHPMLYPIRMKGAGGELLTRAPRSAETVKR